MVLFKYVTDLVINGINFFVLPYLTLVHTLSHFGNIPHPALPLLTLSYIHYLVLLYTFNLPCLPSSVYLTFYRTFICLSYLAVFYLCSFTCHTLDLLFN